MLMSILADLSMSLATENISSLVADAACMSGVLLSTRDCALSDMWFSTRKVAEKASPALQSIRMSNGPKQNEHTNRVDKSTTLNSTMEQVESVRVALVDVDAMFDKVAGDADLPRAQSDVQWQLVAFVWLVELDVQLDDKNGKIVR